MTSLGIDTSQLTLSAFSLNVTTPTRSISATSGVTSSQNSGAVRDADGDYDGSTGKSASVQVSRGAQLYSRLQQLQQQDPAKLKQVLSDAATSLQNAAKNSSGQEQKFLTSLADRFQKAADGDLSALQPPQKPSNRLQAAYAQSQQTGSSASAIQGPGGGHHHHRHGSSAAQQALSSVFSQLNSALSSSSTSSTSSSTSDTSSSSVTASDAAAA